MCAIMGFMDAHGDPAELVTAYCAPGLKDYATRLLESRQEGFREVIKHPYMTGRTGVVLTTDPNYWDLGPPVHSEEES